MAQTFPSMVEEQVHFEKMIPAIDLHCDLLSYLANVPQADVYKTNEIGASVPHLKNGHVKMQVMAIYTDSGVGSTLDGARQLDIYHRLPAMSDGFFQHLPNRNLEASMLKGKNGCYTWLAIENASGFCEEGEPLDKGFKRLDEMIHSGGPLAYIILTHHYENRFGGGNYTEVGLKRDGELLLEYLDGKKIPVDLAHTSDKLAHGILNYIDKGRLDVPVLASHSNFRSIHQHVRNLPDDLANELISRGGLIGINFLRNYINDDDPSVLYDHIRYGVELGASDLMAFGADYFYALNHPDPSRYPIYFPEQETAECYPVILNHLLQAGFDRQFCVNISYMNVLRYYNGLESSTQD